MLDASRLGTHDRFAAGGVRRLPPAARAGAAGCGVSAPAHRVRQRRGTAAGASGCSPERDGAPIGARLVAHANPAAGAHRERPAVVRRRRGRHRRGLGWAEDPREHRLVGVSRSPERDARLDGDRLRAVGVARHGGHLRHSSRTAALASRRRRSRARRRPIDDGWTCAQPASQRVRRRAGGAGARAAGWDRATDSQPAAAQRGRGIEPAQLVAVQIPLPRSIYRNTQGNTSAGGLLVEFDSRFRDVTERVRERFSTVPGVESVAATTPPPLEAHRVACCSERFLAERRRRARPVVGGVVSGQR